MTTPIDMDPGSDHDPDIYATIEAETDARRPVVRNAAWTFDLTGECVYCKKKCTRARTFHAETQAGAESQASAAMSGLCHRKCGGY